jgi:hypothetical protein
VSREEKELDDYQKGDWVSFMKSGEIVIGQVEYLQDEWPRTDQLVTTSGRVSPDSILERRPPTADEDKQ